MERTFRWGFTVKRFFILSLIIATVLIRPIVSKAETITGGGNGTGGSIPVGTSMSAVAYGNNTYVIVGGSGFILNSDDALNWTTVKDSKFLNVSYSDVQFGNGIFVAISQQGKIATSTDGANWTEQNSGTTNSLNDIKYIGGMFYVVGTNGTVLTSTNGSSWTAINIGAGSNMLMDIAYGGAKYAIGARDSSGNGAYVYYSSTGATNSWTAVTVASAGPSLNEITYLKDKFYIFNSDSSIYTSTNAATWSQMINSRLTTNNQVFHGIYDGTKYYLFGSSSENQYGSVFTSTDGTNFVLQPPSAYIVAQGSAYLNGKYFQVGNEGFVVSSDGVNWTYTDSSYYGVATNGTNYVVVGGVSSGGEIFTSTDWQSWSHVTPAYIKANFNGVTYGNGKYVAVGNAPSGSNSITATSSDGISWTLGNSGVTDFLRSVAYGNNKYVAVGLNGRIVSSTDGATWTSRESVSGYHFYGVSYINNYFVAVGGSSTLTTGKVKVKYSVDGTTWVDASPDIVGHFHSITYGNGKYMLVGRDNTSGALKFFSVTATDITNSASYSSAVTVATTSSGDLGSAGFGGVAYGNNVFVAIANGKAAPYQAYILTSADGASWNAIDAATNGRLRGIIFDGINFKVVGLGDTTLTVAAGTVILNSSISPSTGDFDKRTTKQADVTTTITLNGNNLISIMNESIALVKDTDYSIAGNIVTIKKEYLATLPIGTTALTFNFSAGSTQSLQVQVTESLELAAPIALNIISGDASVVLDWTSVSGATGYKIYQGIQAGVYDTTPVKTVSTNTATITGLANGTTYYFVVKATNGAEDSVYSSEVIGKPCTVPDAPTNLTTTAANGRVTVKFTAPANYGGSAITGYNVKVYSGTTLVKTVAVTKSPAAVTGLTNGTAYTFKVSAVNLVGEGTASVETAAVTPSTIPGAVTGVVATVTGSGQVTVSFTPPDNDGGSAITQYIVTSDIGGITVTGTGSPIVVNGLTSGKTYKFVVKAKNGAGTSTAVYSNSVTIP